MTKATEARHTCSSRAETTIRPCQWAHVNATMSAKTSGRSSKAWMSPGANTLAVVWARQSTFSVAWSRSSSIQRPRLKSMTIKRQGWDGNLSNVDGLTSLTGFDQLLASWIRKRFSSWVVSSKIRVRRVMQTHGLSTLKLCKLVRQVWTRGLLNCLTAMLSVTKAITWGWIVSQLWWTSIMKSSPSFFLSKRTRVVQSRLRMCP